MRSTRIKLLVILLFIFSGICGLIYEVAWSKYLSLFIGNTAYSIMIVLATFMGGLALGSYYWGKYADRFTNRLKLYGILEIAIGVYCLFYPFLIGICEKIFLTIATGLDAESDQVVLLLLKFLLSFATLIIPTFFMGGTLPVLSKFLTRTIRDAGKDVATLYYINSMGAVIGAGLAGFFFIRLYSLDGAVAIAAVMNLLIGTIALIVARKIQGVSEPETISEEVPVTTDQQFSPLAVRLAIITAAMSGFIAMVYELAWTRLLANILGSSTYSFSLMLIAFISGITLGSWIVSLIIRRIKNLTVFLGFCQLGTAVSMILTLPFYERLPYYLSKLSTLLTNKPENFPYFLAGEFLFCFLIMIIPTSLSGMSLPVASRIASNDIRLLGKSIGGIFSINTIGTVIGALVTGLLLMPQFGVKQTIELGVLLNILLGLGIVYYEGTMPLGWRIGLASVILLIGIGYKIEFPSWNQQVSISGVFRFLHQEDYASFSDMEKDMSEDRMILWYKEGLNANVAVTQTTMRNVNQKSLIINGKADASTVSDLSTQILLGEIPLILLPDSGNALVIGLGSGITCGSALRHPLRSLDCVEICSEVIECNSFFSTENYHFLQDPRTKIFLDDAITYMKVSQKKYDDIISEPSNPWIAGIGNLFSLEFFNLCKDRLKPGGVLTQWFHTYDMENDTFNLILQTIAKSFNYVSIWKAAEADIVIMASTKPLEINFDLMEKRFAQPAVARDLARIKIYDTPTLLSTQIVSKWIPSKPSDDMEINTEKKPLLEYRAPIAMFTHSALTLTDTVDERNTPAGDNLFYSLYEKQRGFNLENYLNIARYRTSHEAGDYSMLYGTLQKILKLDPGNIEALASMLNVSLVVGALDDNLATLGKLSTISPDGYDIISTYIRDVFTIFNESQSLTGAQAMKYFKKMGATLSNHNQFRLSGELWKGVSEYYENMKDPEISVFDEEAATLAAQSYLLANDLDNAELFISRLKTINPRNAQLPLLVQEFSGKR
ncbi:MAG: fused MFS/spermidine synthase [Bacteroidota bacterium]